MSDDEKKKDLEKINNLLFKFKLNSNNVVFVYTPPKVGSTSLVSSLRISASLKFNVVHIHDELMLNIFTGSNNITIKDIIQYNRGLGKNVYVIDIYRTPIERKISEYFEKLPFYHFNNTEENLNTYSLDKIVNRFNKLFPHLSQKDYFQEVYEIDIPQHFDFEKKYILVENNGIKYIKIRLHDSKEWSKILSEILDTEIVVVNDYETDKKKIGELYKKFKKSYKIPANLYNDHIKECPFLNYYLSEEERKRYFDFWESRLGDEVLSFTKKDYRVYMNISLENQFFNDFQSEHYIDVGCICRPCSKKRNELFLKIKNGEKITEKIIHEENIENTKKNILDNIQMKINKLNNNRRMMIAKKDMKPVQSFLKDVMGRKKI
jgi:hypothetical protein